MEFPMSENKVISATRKWVEDVVVGYNLCPFAKRELVKNRVRFTVTNATNEDDLLQALHAELQRLEDEPEIETTLLIHPDVLQDFYAYNEVLDAADASLAHLELEGVFQIASFHPDYQCADREPGSAEKYTNRSPYPMLHLLREASRDAAIVGYPDVDGIPDRNTAVVNEVGAEKMRAVLAGCFDSGGEARG